MSRLKESHNHQQPMVEDDEEISDQTSPQPAPAAVSDSKTKGTSPSASQHIPTAPSEGKNEVTVDSSMVEPRCSTRTIVRHADGKYGTRSASESVDLDNLPTHLRRLRRMDEEPASSLNKEPHRSKEQTRLLPQKFSARGIPNSARPQLMAAEMRHVESRFSECHALLHGLQEHVHKIANMTAEFQKDPQSLVIKNPRPTSATMTLDQMMMQVETFLKDNIDVVYARAQMLQDELDRSTTNINTAGSPLRTVMTACLGCSCSTDDRRAQGPELQRFQSRPQEATPSVTQHPDPGPSKGNFVEGRARTT